VLSDIQKFPGSGTAPTVSEDQSSTSVVHQSPSAPTQEHQPSSRTSSVGSAIPYDTGRSPISATAPAITEYPPATSDVPQSPLLYSQEHQSSTSRTSSVGSAVSSDIQRSAAPVTTSAIPDHQPPTSDTQQSPSTPPQEQQPPSRTSSVGSAIPYDTQRSHTSATSSTVVEHRPSTSDVQQSLSSYSEEYQSSSRTSSVGSAIPTDIQRPPTSGTAPTVSADQSPTYDARESPFTASTNRAMLSEIKSSPITDASTHEDVQETTSPVVIDDYQTAIVNSKLIFYIFKISLLLSENNTTKAQKEKACLSHSNFSFQENMLFIITTVKIGSCLIGSIEWKTSKMSFLVQLKQIHFIQ
jgi:hypothetical protein